MLEGMGEIERGKWTIDMSTCHLLYIYMYEILENKEKYN